MNRRVWEPLSVEAMQHFRNPPRRDRTNTPGSQLLAYYLNDERSYAVSGRVITLLGTSIFRCIVCNIGSWRAYHAIPSQPTVESRILAFQEQYPNEVELWFLRDRT